MRVALFMYCVCCLALLSSNAEAKYLEDTVRGCAIQRGGGGKVHEYILAAKEVNAGACKEVRVDIPCRSACTIFLDQVDPAKVCLTPHARLGLHQARIEGGLSYTINELLEGKEATWTSPGTFSPPYNSERANAWIKKHGVLRPKDYLLIRPAEAIELWGWRWCS
jgi:hypothetical protein